MKTAMVLSRRDFLGAAVGLGFGGLRIFAEHPDFSEAFRSHAGVGHGELLADPEGLLDLPAGFSYKVIATVGERMSDGFRVPGRADGMAAFPGPGGHALVVCNHELSSIDQEFSAFGPDSAMAARMAPAAFYDGCNGKRPCPGGTTTLLYDTRRQKLKRQHLSLAGTLRNCAGGPTPWNSWVSCEEHVQRADEVYEKDHGYNFEVPAAHGRCIMDPMPLKAMGRFNHEAIAVDPKSGCVYQTEDRGDGVFYRFVPNRPGQLRMGGRLQALQVRDKPGLDTRNWEQPAQVPVSEVLAVEWIDAEEVESPDDDLRHRMFTSGAARFARGEGIWHGRDAVYFACTNGGRAKKGQIWKYMPSPDESQASETQRPARLELFIEPNDPALVENADNLTVAPWGDLIVCEDGPATNRLMGVTPRGQVYGLASHHSGSELAGVTFSPDGSTLFVNIQVLGKTVAITGPWRKA